jgi:hypothetical protein
MQGNQTGFSELGPSNHEKTCDEELESAARAALQPLFIDERR